MAEARVDVVERHVAAVALVIEIRIDLRVPALYVPGQAELAAGTEHAVVAGEARLDAAKIALVPLQVLPQREGLATNVATEPRVLRMERLHVVLERPHVLGLIAAELAALGLLFAAADYVVLDVVFVGVASAASRALVDLFAVGADHVGADQVVQRLLDAALLAAPDQGGVASGASVGLAALDGLVAAAAVTLDEFVEICMEMEGCALF